MRILVADDHSLFRDGLVSLLEAAGHEVVGQVGDGEAAVEAAADLRPDVVLLDLAMPRLDGLGALRRISTEAPEVRVVMLTVSDDETALFEALRSGASGYILKSLGSADFLELLEGVSRDEPAVTPRTTARLMKRLARMRDQTDGARSQLTPRELEVLRGVARGLSNKAIAAEIAVSVNTVKYYMKNILQKLDAQNRAEAATLALREGLIPKD